MEVVRKFGLSLVVVVAGFLRLLPLRFKYLLGSDPYFHFSYIRYVTFLGHWERWYPYVNAPWGLHVAEPLGFWIFPLLIWRIFGSLGLSLYDSFRLAPVVVGLLTVVLVYYLVRTRYGELEAFYSSFLLAVSFGHIFRSMAGYYRGDNYVGLLYILFLLSFFVVLDDKSLGYFGVFFSLILASAVWKAYYPFPLSVFSVVFLYGIKSFLERNRKGMARSLRLSLIMMLYPIVSNIGGKYWGYGMLRLSKGGVLLRVRSSGLSVPWFGDVFLWLFFIVSTTLFLWFLATYLAMNSRWDLAILISFPVLLLFFALHFRSLSDFIGVAGGFRIADINIEASRLVSEMMPPTLWDYFNSFGASLLLFPFFLFGRRDRCVILGSSIPFFLLSLRWSRFLFLASIPVAIMAGVGLVWLWKTVKSRISGKTLKAVSLLLLFYVPLFSFGLGFGNTVTQRPFVDDCWKNALGSLEEIPPNSVVLTWWYQAYWVPFFSNRSVVDGGGPSKLVAEYYLGLVPSSLLDRLGVDYVVVSMEDVEQYRYIAETAGRSVGTLIFFRKGSNGLYYSSGGLILVYHGGSKAILRLLNGTNRIIPTFVQTSKNQVVFPKDNGPLEAYVSPHDGYAVVFSKNMTFTPLIGLLLGNLSSYKLVFSSWGRVKVYAYIHPKVVVQPLEEGLLFKTVDCSNCTLKLVLYSEDEKPVKVLVYNSTPIVEVPYSFLHFPLLRYILYYSNGEKKRYFDAGCFNPEEYERTVRQ